MFMLINVTRETVQLYPNNARKRYNGQKWKINRQQKTQNLYYNYVAQMGCDSEVSVD